MVGAPVLRLHAWLLLTEVVRTVVSAMITLLRSADVGGVAWWCI